MSVDLGRYVQRRGAHHPLLLRPGKGKRDTPAHVYLPRVVIALDMPTCFRGCWDPGAYSSFKGLTAAVRGLRLRRR